MKLLASAAALATAKQNFGRWALWGLLLAGLGLAVWINLPLPAPVERSERKVASLPSAPPFEAGQRILILSPHPDDETLCCGGMIQQAQAAGAKVYVAWITAGDGFEFDAAVTQHTLHPTAANMRALGQARAKEARQAAKVLGIPAERTFMLGYPDGSLFQLYTVNYVQPYTAPHTRASAVYVDGALHLGKAFTGQNLEDDVRTVLDEVKPDLVLVPAPADFHPDHHTLTYLAVRMMALRGEEEKLRFWVVHGGLEWPIPKGEHPKLPLTLPPRAAGLPWQRVDLTPEQQARKREAIKVYRTQTEVIGRFMWAFDRTNELLSPQPLPVSPPSVSDAP